MARHCYQKKKTLFFKDQNHVAEDLYKSTFSPKKHYQQSGKMQIEPPEDV